MAFPLKPVLPLLTALALSACALIPDGAYTNKRLTQSVERPNPVTGGPSQASFKLRPDRRAAKCETLPNPPGNPKRQSQALVLLALSGGGSRAAYFSALAMLEMERLTADVDGVETDLLHELDAISTVSGGGLAGAFYAVSHDPGQPCAGHTKKVWSAEAVEELMPRNYLRRWILNWFNPVNALRFWFTHYDRTDIMAQTFANNLFGDDVSLGKLNPLRPNLILNTTSGTAIGDGSIRFGEALTFTREDFSRICSDIDQYSVARGVMASATFPGAFNFMTLRDYADICGPEPPTPEPPRRFLHVFDGGNSDNLGLTSLRRVIWEALADRHGDRPHLPYRRVIVVLIDSFVQSPGADPDEPDPRSSTDFIVDSNFLDATDSLLQANRERLLDQFKRGELFPFAPGSTKKIAQDYCTNFFHGLEVRECSPEDPARWTKINNDVAGKLKFVHVQFSATPRVTEGCANPNCLARQLNRIATSFRLSDDVDARTGLTDREAIACAVPAIFGRVDADARKPCGKLALETSAPLKADWEEIRDILRTP